MSYGGPPICMYCAHRLPYGRCLAFGGDPIPREILLSEFDHRQPHPEDDGRQFTPMPGNEMPSSMDPFNEDNA